MWRKILCGGIFCCFCEDKQLPPPPTVGPQFVALPEHVKPRCPEVGPYVWAALKWPICIRQRSYRHKNLSYYDARLKAKFGSDWRAVRGALFALWEVVLSGLESNLPKSLSKTLSEVASFPFRIRLYHEASQQVWAEWTIQNAKELAKVLPFIMTEDKRSFILCQKDPSTSLEAKDLATWSQVRDIDCAMYMSTRQQGWFYFVSGRLFIWLQKRKISQEKTKHNDDQKPVSDSKFRYIASINGVTLVGEHFASQVEYIRFLLKRKGRCSKRQTFTTMEEFDHIESRDKKRRLCPPGPLDSSSSPPGF